MAKTRIPTATMIMLAGRAAGWCEFPGCPERLDRDVHTWLPLNLAEYAHVIADSPAGPRGDANLSPALAQDPDNLILLCPKHHALVDKREHVHRFSLEVLRAYKLEHEARVSRLTAIRDDLKTTILVLKGPIGSERWGVVRMEQARRAVLPRFPNAHEIVIDLTRTSLKDDDPLFWRTAEIEVVRQVERAVLAPTNPDRPTHLSVFALAPVPLLMLLGRVLGDLAPVDVFQKHRSPDDWQWEPGHEHRSKFVVSLPPASLGTLDVAIKLSASGKVSDDEVENAMAGVTADVVELALDEPRVDAIRTRAQLVEFRTEFRQLLTNIRTAYGAEVRVHIFPALPNSLAVECGRVLLPKVDPRIEVYDWQGAEGFVRALSLVAGHARGHDSYVESRSGR